MVQKDAMSAQVLEMRRGAVVLAMLSQLNTPRYGYELAQLLEQEAVNIEAGTLYPLLRRLEKQGFLESTWDTAENRPRKYYRRSSEGDRFYAALKEEWRAIASAVSVMIKEND